MPVKCFLNNSKHFQSDCKPVRGLDHSISAELHWQGQGFPNTVVPLHPSGNEYSSGEHTKICF
jgi:hypothetical protein